MILICALYPGLRALHVIVTTNCVRRAMMTDGSVEQELEARFQSGCMHFQKSYNVVCTI